MTELTLERLIEELNNDLKWEYTAAIQYIQHLGVITGPEYGDILKELAIHANEEIAHAIVLSQQITFLGGIPESTIYEVQTSKDNKEMLEQDLAGELDAIRRYKERIWQAEQLQEYALSQKLREILAMEQEHAMDLQSALGK